MRDRPQGMCAVGGTISHRPNFYISLMYMELLATARQAMQDGQRACQAQSDRVVVTVDVGRHQERRG
jgi:hypothetical protein